MCDIYVTPMLYIYMLGVIKPKFGWSSKSVGFITHTDLPMMRESQIDRNQTLWIWHEEIHSVGIKNRAVLTRRNWLGRNFAEWKTGRKTLRRNSMRISTSELNLNWLNWNLKTRRRNLLWREKNNGGIKRRPTPCISYGLVRASSENPLGFSCLVSLLDSSVTRHATTHAQTRCA